MGCLPVICDHGASCYMPHSFTGMINYREAKLAIRTASGRIYSGESYGDLPTSLPS